MASLRGLPGSVPGFVPVLAGRGRWPAKPSALLNGAMSYGLISAEAHEALAIAMNRLKPGQPVVKRETCQAI